MKLSNADRLRIKLWLDKDPNAEDKGKYLEVEGVTYARSTTYFGPINNWKVRIAYELETGYPVVMSAPIPGGQESKKKAAAKYPMVPKLPAKAAPKKPAGKGKLTMAGADAILKEVYQPSAFQKALDLELKQMKQGMKQYLNTPWDWNLAPKPGLTMPKGVSKKAAKGSKALYGPWSTLYVIPGQTIPGNYYKSKLEGFTVPHGYEWVKADSSLDLWTLVKKVSA